MKWLGVLLLVTAVFGASENPDENESVHDPDLFEGDMILSREQIRRAENGEDIDSSRKRGASRSRRWPNGVVPYVIDQSLRVDSRAVDAVNAGMQEWTMKTCIRFQKRTIERAFVNFTSGGNQRGCSSFVGRIGRDQAINLARGCWTRGIVAHEIGHAIGFYHEQSRRDRDDYITVQQENIIPNFESNFAKYSRSVIDSLGTSYDYGSLMHYGSRAFSRNGLPTIVVKKQGVTIGQRQGLSAIDAQQADLLYQRECARRGEAGGGATPLPPTATRLPTTPGRTTLPPETTRLPPTRGSCQDRNSRCGDWSRLFCSFYRFRINCRRRCRLC
ncbi:zinc metalloproteinase nas-15-like isoform X1 [Montipora capricornis]|uniref:zinc metalloproteinase nas-15-like isoform X1 n=1 Tax=Montipora capricornis TaxID=246305 RepID=UPI0035F1A6EF